MKISYHWMELEVAHPGALLRFQYVLPSNGCFLSGVTGLVAGILPGSYTRRGLLTIEALDRKLLLANLPVLAGGAIGVRQDVYPVWEPLDAGRLINGNYMDGHKPNDTFSPYCLKIVFKTLNY